MKKSRFNKRAVKKNNSVVISPEMSRLIANVTNDITIPNYGNVLRPQDGTILAKGGGKGLRLYEEVEKDGRAKAVLEKRKNKVTAREWVVLASEDDKSEAQEAAELVENALKKIALDRITGDLLDATLFGFSVSEIIWTVKDKLILPQTIKKHRCARFVFDTDWNLRLLTTDAMLEGESLPPKKFIVHRHDCDGSDPYGRGLGRTLFWNVFFKREGVCFWAHFLEKFASPTPFGKYPLGTPPAEIDKIVQMLTDLAQSGVLVMPLGSEVDFLESTNADTMSFENWCRYWDEETSVTVLGETLTTSMNGAGSRAASETHLEVSDGLADGDADAVCETLNETLVKWIVDYNRPGAPYPTIWRPRTKNEAAIEDLKKKRAERQKAEMDNLEQARQLGFIPAEGLTASYSEIFDKEMISLPISDVQTQQNSFAAPIEHGDDHGLSALIDQVDQSMQPIFSDWVDLIKKELKKSIDGGEDLQTFSEKILTLYPELELTPFADTLASAMMVADGKGFADVLDESK